MTKTFKQLGKSERVRAVRCTTRLISATVELSTGTVANATLSRAGVLYDRNNERVTPPVTYPQTASSWALHAHIEPAVLATARTFAGSRSASAETDEGRWLSVRFEQLIRLMVDADYRQLTKR